MFENFEQASPEQRTHDLYNRPHEADMAHPIHDAARASITQPTYPLNTVIGDTPSPFRDASTVCAIIPVCGGIMAQAVEGHE